MARVPPLVALSVALLCAAACAKSDPGDMSGPDAGNGGASGTGAGGSAAGGAGTGGSAAGGGGSGGSVQDARLDTAAADSGDARADTGATTDTRADASAPDAGADARPDANSDGQAPRAPWDWVGVVGTGQSLSVGEQAATVSANRQPYANLKLSLGTATVPPFDASNAQLAMVPLVEPIRAFAGTYPSAYPRNIYGETPHTAMANQLTSLARAAGGDFLSVHTVVGESGQPMSVIRKGATEVVTGAMSMGRAYAATLFEATAITRLARAAAKSYGVGAIVITHGEADTGSATYENDLVTLWTNYNQDLRPITGQTASIPMLVSQQHSVPDGSGSRSAATQAEWRAGVDHPGDIVCTGPKYQYTYAADHVHLGTREYERLGEKSAQVYFERAVLGHDWQPLQPTGVARNGRVITVTFHVPVGPLAWDSALGMPHQTALTQWAQGRGFEVRSGGTMIAIDSVAIAGDTVQITCATAPPAGVTVGYAATADGTFRNGGTARWGQLRDSDPFTGTTSGAAQPNYAVAFEMTVP